MASRYVPLTALFLVAVMPLALAKCKPTDTGKGEASVASTPPVIVPTPPNVPARPILPERTCVDLDKEIEQTIAERDCKVDDDCTTGAAPCSCSIPMAKTATPKLTALLKDFNQKNCLAMGPPRPCATCEAPPPTRCAKGKCTEKIVTKR